jgi:hypothetical protein
MKTWLLICITGIVLATGACAATFLLGKNGKGFFFGSETKVAYDMLCTSGDLKKVLAATHLDAEMKQTLYAYNCSAERSREKVEEIYGSMDPKQREDIQTAFKKNGYDINYLPYWSESRNTTSSGL